MKEETTFRPLPSSPIFMELESQARAHLQRFLQKVLEDEVREYFGRESYERIPEEAVGKVKGYRNGYGKPRKLTTSIGTLELRRPRVRGLEEGEKFESRILPLFVRSTEEVNQTLLELYLHGLSSGDFDLALRGLLGEDAPLSASTLDRLKVAWQQEYEEWKLSRLDQHEVVYLWVDGIYVKAGLEKEKSCLLIALAGLTNGKKVFVAIESGYRESKENWAELLRGLKNLGMSNPKLVIGDGALGIWSAMTEVYPFAQQQRCWNHRKLNILNQLPQKAHIEATNLLKKITAADSQKAATKARTDFQDWATSKGYDKAATLIEHDWERMTAYFNFPKEHWKHLKTTNPIESPFASARLRTDATKRFKKTTNATAMLFKLLQVAEKSFRKIQHPHLLHEVYHGATYQDGIKQPQNSQPLQVTA